MRIILFLLFVFVCNCSSQMYKADYNSYIRTLKDYHLKGLVKDVVEYRLDENNEKGINGYDTVMISVNKFTDFGS